MAIDLEKGIITLYGKTTKVEILAKKMATLSGNQLYGFFSARDIKLPRQINIAAMASVLNDKIKFLHSKSLSKDKFKRLCYYKDFTEYQMVELFNELAGDRDSFDKYRFNLAMLIITNYAALDLNDGELNYIKSITKEKMEPFSRYADYISNACLECEGTFDGVSLEVLNEILPESATQEEISGIMGKYGIVVNDRLTKEEYQQYIEYVIGDSIANAMNENPDELTLAALSTFARRNDIDMQPSMDKRMMTNYAMYYLSQCEIPTTSVRRLTIPDEMEIPEFTIDLDSIDAFGRDDVPATKVVSYPGDENDLGELQAILDEVNNKQNDFIEMEIVEGLTAPLAVGSVTESAPYVETEEDLAESIENAPDMSDEEIQEMIAEANVEEDDKVEDPVTIDLGVTKNEGYGSKKYKNVGKKPIGLIISSVCAAIAIAAVIAVIYGIAR